jgi:hypothetical protein
MPSSAWSTRISSSFGPAPSGLLRHSPFFPPFTRFHANPVCIFLFWHSLRTHVILPIYGCTVLVELGHFFNFLILSTVGWLPWTGDQPVARPLPRHRTTQTQKSMPRVGSEPTIPVFQRAKTVHALDHTATLIGTRELTPLKMLLLPIES